MHVTNLSSYIKKTDQGWEVVSIRRKDNADSIVGIMAPTAIRLNAIQALDNPPPEDTFIPRGSWVG